MAQKKRKINIEEQGLIIAVVFIIFIITIFLVLPNFKKKTIDKGDGTFSSLKPGVKIPTTQGIDSGLETVTLFSENVTGISQESVGYIIELEEAPLAKMYSKTDFSAQKVNEISNHKEKLANEKKNVKQEIFNKLYPSNKGITGFATSNNQELPIIGEYENVFNGFALNINDRQAEEIKNISGIKKIHKNYIVKATLQESVPLIGGTKAWQQLDSFGETLTGKGITIGVIDSGIDYTHKDFNGTGRLLNKVIVNSSHGRIRDYALGNGSIVYIKNITDNEIYITNLSSEKETKLTNDNVMKTLIKVSNNKILYHGENDSGNYLYLYYINSTNPPIQLVDVGERIYLPTNIVIYKNTVAWVDNNDGEIALHVYDLELKTINKLTTMESIRNPKYLSIDNDKLIFTGVQNQTSKIFIYDLNTKELNPIISKPGSITDINANKNKIVYVHYYSPLSGLYLYDLEKNEEIQLIKDLESKSWPTIDKNYVVWYDLPGEIYLYDLIQNKQTKLTCNPVFEISPKIKDNVVFFLEHSRSPFGAYNIRYINITEFDPESCNFEFPTQKVIGGYDFVNNDEDPIDDYGHGTHVASIIAGNGILKGVAPDAKLYVYKTLNNYGSGLFSWIMSAIEQSADPNNDGDLSDHLDIISLSLGGFGNPDDVLSRAIDNIVDLGVIAVVAAGNEGPSNKTIGTPGTARNAITVGATFDKQQGDNFYNIDKLSSCFNSLHNPNESDVVCFSSRGPVQWDGKEIQKPDIVAPGVEICAAQLGDSYSTSFVPYLARPDVHQCIDNDHVAISGTSMSTPMVSGAIALLKQKFPDFSPKEIKSLIVLTADDLNLPKNIQGNGMINISRALEFNKKPPVLELKIPSVIHGESIDILGTVTGQDILSYKLYYTNTANLGTKTEICTGTTEVHDFRICNWILPANLGNYIIELVADLGSSILSTENEVQIKNTEISYPLSEDDSNIVYSISQNIIINGTSIGVDFQSYTIALCNNETNECIDDAIILENSGLLKTQNNQLGIINISKIKDSSLYVINLTTNYLTYNLTTLNSIYIETNFQEGWPKYYNSTGYFLYNYIMKQPKVTDINNDQKKELIFVQGTSIHILDHKGDYLVGWPKSTDTTHTEIFDFKDCLLAYPPALGDINNNGFKDIIVQDSCGYVHALSYTGQYLFPPKKIESPDSYWYLRTLSLADLNNDNYLDIIIPSNDNTIHVLDHEGNYLDGWPIELIIPSNPSSVYSRGGVSVADLNNNNKTEIIISVISCDREVCSMTNPSMSYNIWTFILNQTGGNLENWPKSVPGFASIIGPTAADIDNDNELEIILNRIYDTVHIFNLDGTYANGWPVQIEKPNEVDTSTYYNLIRLGESSVGDIDNDGNLDIVFWGGEKTGTKYCVYAFTNTGIIHPNFPVCNSSEIENYPARSQILANIDSDPELEIMYGKSYLNRDLKNIYAINHDGSIVSGFPKHIGITDRASTFYPSYPVADLDNDGDNELIVVKPYDQVVYVYDMPGIPSINTWSQAKNNERNTGALNPLKRFYFLDSDNDSYGNPHNYTQQIENKNGYIILDSKTYVSNNLDCNDQNKAINPLIPDKCGDNIDNNCNNLIDETCPGPEKGGNDPGDSPGNNAGTPIVPFTKINTPTPINNSGSINNTGKDPQKNQSEIPAPPKTPKKGFALGKSDILILVIVISLILIIVIFGVIFALRDKNKIY
ncbi:S8 family serine peptidase [Candidatus Pacearchaeota archaeon]|nr:S8 family serine peptidase [Candidatus Pacearchaeota archaeon]